MVPGSTSICLWALLDLRLSRLFSHVQEGTCRKVLVQRLRREKRRGERALAVVEARFSDFSIMRSVCLDDSYSFVSVFEVFIHIVGGRVRCNGLLYFGFLISLAVANQSFPNAWLGMHKARSNPLALAPTRSKW